jgi:hypothetical protein
VAYISIVDVYNNQPIDLEDWSAQKGFSLSIPPDQSVAAEWNLRLVSAGFYTVTVIFAEYGNSPPKTSSRVILKDLPKMNLNPSNIIPVAFGVPVLLVIIFGLINYRERRWAFMAKIEITGRIDMKNSRAMWLLTLVVVTLVLSSYASAQETYGSDNAQILLNMTDSDKDGIQDVAEMTLGTNPYNADTDGDGIADKQDSDPTFTDKPAIPSEGDKGSR